MSYVFWRSGSQVCCHFHQSSVFQLISFFSPCACPCSAILIVTDSLIEKCCFTALVYYQISHASLLYMLVGVQLLTLSISPSNDYTRFFQECCVVRPRRRRETHFIVSLRGCCVFSTSALTFQNDLLSTSMEHQSCADTS